MAKQIFTSQGVPVPPKVRSVTGQVAVYNLETGKADMVFPVDAKERIARGGWSYDKPKPEAETADQPSAETDTESFEKAGPVKRTGKKG